MKSSILNLLQFRLPAMGLLMERVAQLQALRPELEGNRGQTGLVRASGASKSVVNQWFSGAIQSMKPKYALNLERNLGLNSVWLMTGEGSPELDAEASLLRSYRLASEAEKILFHALIGSVNTRIAAELAQQSRGKVEQAAEHTPAPTKGTPRAQQHPSRDKPK